MSRMTSSILCTSNNSNTDLTNQCEYFRPCIRMLIVNETIRSHGNFLKSSTPPMSIDRQ